MPAHNGSGSASSSTAWTTGLAVGGCAVAAVGIAGFVFMKKRTQKQEEEEADETAQTPATGSPSNEVADFKDEMQTPVAV
jgi:flagellar basal body-associated protein FliL